MPKIQATLWITANWPLILVPMCAQRRSQSFSAGDVGIKAKSAFHCISANALCAYSADTFNPTIQ